MELPLWYTRLVSHYVSGPQSFSYFIPFLILYAGLMIPPSMLSRSVTTYALLPIAVASAIHSWRIIGGVDVISVDTLLWTIYLLVIKDPRKDFKHIVKTKRAPHEGDKKTTSNGYPDMASARPTQENTGLSYEAYPKALWPRLCWVSKLLISIRLEDWIINDHSHDQRQPSKGTGKSHISFIVTALLRTISGYLILDVTAYCIARDPWFHNVHLSILAPLVHGGLIDAIGPTMSTYIQFLRPWEALVYRSTLVAAQAWSLISQQFHLPCCLPVMMHYFALIPDEMSPHLWAPFFGPASSIADHGLRGFWAKYWHQTMRTTVSGPGYALADALGLRRSTNGDERKPSESNRSKQTNAMLRGFVVAFVAFFLSGVVHMGLVPPDPIFGSLNAMAIRLRVAGFFWLQPLGLALETLIGGILTAPLATAVSEAGTAKLTRRIGNLSWIALWSCICFPLLADAGRHLGYFRVYTVPFSIINGLKHNQWVMWDILK